MCLHTLYNPDAKGMLVFKDLLLLELSDDINQIKMQQEFTEINSLEKTKLGFSTTILFNMDISLVIP